MSKTTVDLKRKIVEVAWCPKPTWLRLLEVLKIISGNALRIPKEGKILKNSRVNDMFVGKQVTELRIAIVTLTIRTRRSSRARRRLPKQMF